MPQRRRPAPRCRAPGAERDPEHDTAPVAVERTKNSRGSCRARSRSLPRSCAGSSQPIRQPSLRISPARFTAFTMRE